MRIVLWSMVFTAIVLVFWAEVVTPIVQGKYKEPERQRQLPVHATLYLDKSVAKNELQYVAQAATEWYDATNRQIVFNIAVLPAEDIDTTKSVVIRNVTTEDPDIIVLDSYNEDSTLGYCDRNAILPSINLVYSRIEDDEFAPVIMHELGHYLGLEHSNTKEHPERGLGTLMYSSLTHGSHHITQEDLVQFCDIYHCDASKYHGFPQVQ